MCQQAQELLSGGDLSHPGNFSGLNNPVCPFPSSLLCWDVCVSSESLPAKGEGRTCWIPPSVPSNVYLPWNSGSPHSLLGVCDVSAASCDPHFHSLQFCPGLLEGIQLQLCPRSEFEVGNWCPGNVQAQSG